MAQSSYHFENKEIKAGTKEHFLVPFTTAGHSTLLPITVFNGIKNGKTLGITAGVHGFELAPIMAAQGLITSIDPKKLTGVVIMVQIANLESLEGIPFCYKKLRGFLKIFHSSKFCEKIVTQYIFKK